MIAQLGQCDRHIAERMVWHFLMVDDDYGRRVGEGLGITPEDLKSMEPLPHQVLNEDEQRRLANLGNNGDDEKTDWPKHTSSVPNLKVDAEDIMNGWTPPNEPISMM